MKLFYILILLTIHLFGSAIEKAKDLFDNQEKYKEAIEIFSKFKNDAETEYYLGKAYYYGLGVEKDLKKSFEYARKSADKNNSSGLNLLGAIYSDGEVVNKNEKLALNYYNKAADLGNVKAIKNLASMYENGKYVKQDIAKAKELYQKLIDLNDKDGYLGFGNIYTYHDLNREEAFKYYNIFESLGGKHPGVFQNMAVIYRNSNNTQKEIEYHRKASELGNNHSMLTLFDLLKIEKNYKYKLNQNEHFDYLIKSAEHGNTDAILEILYNDELHKLISNKALFSWMKKGVELKLKLAYFAMYSYYIDKNDHINLKKFLEKSYYEDKNLEMGCYLSSYYLNLSNNQPEKANYEKAFNIANKIVKENRRANDLYICYHNLSYLYADGKFVAEDLKKAIEIRKKSFKVSVDFAKEKDLDYIKEKEYELENSLKLFEKLDIKDEKVFPIIDNFTKKEQVTAVLETKKYFFFSVSDKSIKMYDKNNLSFIKEFRPWISLGLEGNPLKMVFDENTNILYFSVFNSIKDMNKNDLIHAIDIQSGKIVKTLKNIKPIKNIYLSISDDGKYIVAINNNNLINIINTENNETQHYNIGDPVIFLAANIIKEKDDYTVNVVSTDKKLYKFSIKLARNISMEDFNFQTNFRTFNETYAEKIFENKNNINIENIKINSKDNFELKINNKFKEFDLKDLIFNEQNKSIISDNKSSSSLSINQGYDGKILEFINDKTKNKKEYLLMGNVKLLNTYPIKDKYILLITSDITFMPVLNENGEIIANLQGFSAFPKDIDIKNNKLIYLGLDNVIHSFNLDVLHKLKYVENEFDEEVLEGFSKQFGNKKEEITKDFQNYEYEELKNLRNIYNLSFTPTKDQVNNFFQLFMHKKETIYPTFSLYLKNENDWILYTPEGLFDYSGNGKDLLKYHQNQGLYKEAKIIENDKLFEKFYRPDLIRKILAGEKVEIPMDVKSVILNIMPPELKFLENKMISNKDIELTYQICDAGNGIADQKLIINGQAIIPPQSRDFSIQKSANRDNNCSVYKSIHTLYPGKSYIELKAYDKDMNIANTSNKLEVNTDYKIIEKTDNLNADEIKKLEKNERYTILEKSNLYFLSLAVSNYEDSSYNLKYPVKDVNSVKENFLKSSKTTFENIYTYKLENDQVTKNNINDIFNEISNKLKFNDTFVLYIAGHGSTIDGKYEFIPYKINEKISINDIKNNLSKIANYTNKSLVMLDTCYSGALIDNLNDEVTSKRFSHDNNSINYIVASSSSQVALEGYKDQGVFTYSVLDAFKNNEKLKVSNLAEHVLKLVPQITEEKFHYKQNPQIKLNENFIIINN